MGDGGVTWIIRSRYEEWREARDVALIFERDGRRSIALPLTMKPLADGEFVTPTFSGQGENDGQEFLQAVLDHAWEAGLRPKGFLDTPNQIAALKDHLADLRSIVFKGEVKPKGATAS